MKVPTELQKKLEDGNYNGLIVRVDERTRPFTYCDFAVKVDSADNIELKFGCPPSISVDKNGNPTTKLAKVCKRLGILAPLGEETDLDKAIGLNINFDTENETTDKGTFARILLDTVKLAK